MTAKISDPSISVIDVNVPDVYNVKAEFRYNYYTKDESNVEFTRVVPSEKSPRYVRLTWTPPRLSLNDMTSTSGGTASPVGLILKNADKITSEDNYVNPDYVSHIFSDVTAIEQGSADMENYSRITNSSVESVFKMAKEQAEVLLKEGEKSDDLFKQQLPTFIQTYYTLSNLPASSLGLRVIRPGDQVEDDASFLRSVLNNVSLSVKINKKLIPDIFRGSKMTGFEENITMLSRLHSKDEAFVKNRKETLINPVSVTTKYSSDGKNIVRMIGYIIDRYEPTPAGFIKNKTFYLDGGSKSTFDDLTVLYGREYIYSVRSVASVSILAYDVDKKTPIVAEVFLSSRPNSTAVECYEYVPPPEPEYIKFIYNYSENNMTLVWEAPTNPQQDIKQYQVFRRKSIRHPFELIAMYDFSDSTGPNGLKYLTGEVVDGNAVGERPELDYLITKSKIPVLMHTDKDFAVDAEMGESSDFIYAVCSVDAHGMISNYSTQYRVFFDIYRNRLVPRVICDKGSPRPYPNMNLKMDAFKDAIRLSGQEQRDMQIFFSPEYLRLSDSAGTSRNIVQVQRPDKPTEKPYYLLQLINLDNQKFQTLKLIVKDENKLTSP